jgi:ketol-acid reductoisomerase
MVKVTGVETRKNSEGQNFTVLVLLGGLDMVKSKETGRFYATARKTTISSTFSEETAKDFVGTKLPGRIEKVECEPYDFVVEGGEVIELDYTWAYNPSPNTTEEVVMGEHVFA